MQSRGICQFLLIYKQFSRLYPSPVTGQDSHSVMLDYSVFANVPQLDAADIPNLQGLYDANTFDTGLPCAYTHRKMLGGVRTFL